MSGQHVKYIGDNTAVPIPSFTQGSGNTWHASHTDPKDLSAVSFFAEGHGTIEVYPPENSNKAETKDVVRLTAQSQALSKTVYVERATALSLFNLENVVGNQSDYSQTANTGQLNTTEDWTSRLPVLTFTSNAPPVALQQSRFIVS